MFNFVPSTIPHNVFVIGAGGTGSRLMPMLAQFLRSITRGVTAQGWIENPNIWVIDDDVVEQKNILRQNFIDMDVGKHKAAVVAERYSRAYSVNIVPIMQKVNFQNQNVIYETITSTLTSMNAPLRNLEMIFNNSIVIICVDSVEARRDIFNTFTIKPSSGNPARTFFIDAGNEDNFGQIQFFTPTILHSFEKYDVKSESTKIPKLVPVSVDVSYIPMPVEFYKNLVDTPAQGSCADLNQTLAINAIMATQIMGIVQNYYYRKPMNYNKVSISLNGGNFTTHNTFNEFKSRAISLYDYETYSRGRVYSKEKNDSQKTLTFTANCEYASVISVSNLLVVEIAEMKRKEEEAKAKEAAEALKKQALEAKEKEKKEAAERLKRLRETKAIKEKALAKDAADSKAFDEATKLEVLSTPALEPVRRVRTRVELPAVEVEVAIPETWVSSLEAETTPTPAPRRRRSTQTANAATEEAVAALMNVVSDNIEDVPDDDDDDGEW